MAISTYVKDDKTYYEVFVKVRDSKGRQVARRKRGIKTKRKAEETEFNYKYKMVDIKDRYLWEDWVDHCLKGLKYELKTSTHEQYTLICKKRVSPFLKGKWVDEITKADVYDIVFNKQPGVSHWYRRTILKKIIRVFNLAIEEGFIKYNPAVGIKVTVPEISQAVLSKSEIEVLLREARACEHRYFDVWSLALLTGMRSGELFALKWTKVDFESNLIHIDLAWTRQNGFGSTKTAKNRVVPMSKSCQSYLAKLKLRRGSDEFVLPRLSEWAQGGQAKVIKDFCKGLGITEIKFHDLRATFITQLLMNGVSIPRVMSMVGHSSLKTTQGYLRLCGMDVVGATEALGIEIPEERELGNVISGKFGKN